MYPKDNEVARCDGHRTTQLICLLVNLLLQLRLPHGFRDKQAAAFLLGMLARHDFGIGADEQGRA